MAFNDTSLIPFASPGDQPKMPPEMKTLLDSVLSYANTGARRGGQTAAQGRALGEALHTVGGVYGYNLQAQGASDKTAVDQGVLNLEKQKAFMPIPQGSGVGDTKTKEIANKNIIDPNRPKTSGIPRIALDDLGQLLLTNK
jgi:hypothetical protein